MASRFSGLVAGAGVAAALGPCGASWWVAALALAWIAARPRAPAACPAVLGALAVTMALADVARVRVAETSGLDCMVEGRIDRVRRGNATGRVIGFDLAVHAGDAFCAVAAAERDAESDAEVPPRRMASAVRGLVRLSSFQPLDVREGERWRLSVRLRAPRASSNPGAELRELAYWRARIAARGYVRAAPSPERVGFGTADAARRVQRYLSARIQVAADGNGGLLAALLTGHREPLRAGHWRMLADAGLTHLFVVSGLHLGLLGGATLLLLRLVGARSNGAFAGGITLAVTGAWAWMCGLGLPVCRAWCMLAIYLVARSRQRHLDATRALALAAVLLFLLDPLVVIDPGFWLSFLAVWALVVMVNARNAALPMVRAQVQVFLVLAPVLAALAASLPVSSVIWNLIWIPLIAMVVLPLGLTLLLLDLVGVEAAAHGMLRLAELLEGGLATAARASYLQAVKVPPLAIAVVAIAAALVLGMRLPARLGGLLCGLWLLVWQAPDRPPYGEVAITVLDVGQGLSAVVRTRNRTLLFDAGGGGADGNAGSSVVVPALRAYDVRRLDLVIISHADLDHAGGVAGVREAVASSAWRGPSELGFSPCRRGERWSWDGVEFETLHPGPGDPSGDRNRHSCVLVVRAATAAALIPGDIDRYVERRIAPSVGAVDLVVAAHHGSRTSSGRALVRHTRPQWVVYSAGAPSAFGHPHPEVVSRWRAAGACDGVTGAQGAFHWRSDRPERAHFQRPRSDGWWLWRPDAATVSSDCALRRATVRVSPGNPPFRAGHESTCGGRRC